MCVDPTAHEAVPAPATATDRPTGDRQPLSLMPDTTDPESQATATSPDAEDPERSEDVPDPADRFESAVADLRVAAVVAGCAIVLTVVLRVVLDVPVGDGPLLVPLVVYPAYLVAQRVGPFPPLDTVRAWSVVAVAVTVAVFVAVVA